MESSGDEKGILSDGARVLVGELNSENSRNELRVGNNDMTYGRNRILELMSRDDGMGVMNLVGRVLNATSATCKAKEEGLSTSKSRSEVNLVEDLNTCKGLITDLTPADIITFKEAGNDKKGLINDSTPADVIAIKVAENDKDLPLDLVPNEVVRDGDLEPEEVNDARAGVLVLKECGEQSLAEKEGRYRVSDLVWGKVRSHPWWPGQIFAHSDASEKALGYFKKDAHLIAYFGDQTFAWNEETNIKPFKTHFSKLEKQGSTEEFAHALNCALDEVSRRVENGLSCSCLPLEVREKIANQVVSNAGIREESSKLKSGDSLSGPDSFSPGELVQFLELLAGSPLSKTDRLQYVTKKAQLLGFNRWKGRYELPVLEVAGKSWEEDAHLVAKGINDTPSRKRKMNDGDGLHKHKKLPVDERLGTKEKFLSVLLSSSLQNGNRKTVRKEGRKRSTSSGKKHDLVPSVSRDSHVKRKKDLQSGASEGAGKSEMEDVSTMNLTPEEVLTKLSMIARNPKQAHNVLNPELGLLCEFRNSFSVEKDSTHNENKHAGMNNEEQSNSKVQDSYSTERIIETQDHESSEFKTSREASSKLEGNVNKAGDSVAMEIDTVNSSVPGNEIAKDHNPTVMILEFTNSESIPSTTRLNEIFTRYGPLNESETKILSKSNRAKVVFKRREDADVAFSSPGKFSIFGPSLFKYHLVYAPKARKACDTPKKN